MLSSLSGAGKMPSWGEFDQNLSSMQALLPSKTAGAAALALEALGILCERGGISFLDAWKLLRGMGLQQQPEQELQRAAWVALLGQAHHIADEQAEQAALHHSALWEAARDPTARVQCYITPPPAQSVHSTPHVGTSSALSKRSLVAGMLFKPGFKALEASNNLSMHR